jgi:Ca2+/Na+ antiporter
MVDALMKVEYVFAPTPARMLALAAMALYAGAALASWAGRSGRCTPGQRTLMHWGFMAIACLVVRHLGHGEMAQGILFGTSVAVMLLAVGSAALGHPAQEAPQGRGWVGMFMVATTLMLFLAGFYGFVLWRGVGVLLWRGAVPLVIEGLVVLSLWQEPEEYSVMPAAKREAGDGHAMRMASAGTGETRWNSGAIVAAMEQARKREGLRKDWRWVVLAVWAGAAALVGVGAWAATRGELGVPAADLSISTQAIAGTLLSMALVLPMVRWTRRAADEEPVWEAVGSHMGIIFLNLCALLPALALWPYVRTILPAIRPGLAGLGWPIDWGHFRPLVFPYACWRIDTVALVLGSLVLLPAWMGKWKLGRAEGLLLVLGYLAYVMLTALGVRG